MVLHTSLGLCLLGFLVFSTVGSEESPLINGLYFKEIMGLALTSRRVTVPLDLPFRTILHPLDRLQSQIGQTSRMVGHLQGDHPVVRLMTEALTHAENAMEEHRDSFTDFLKSYSSVETRFRRGLVDGIGVLARSFFGVATMSDVNHLASKLMNLHKISEEEKRMLNIHTDLLNRTIRDLNTIKKAESKLAISLNQTLKVINQMSETVHELILEFQASQTMVNIHLFVEDITRDINLIQVGIADLFQNIVSRHIITDKFFLELLVQLEGKYRMLFPARINYLPDYRQICSVIVFLIQRSLEFC